MRKRQRRDSCPADPEAVDDNLAPLGNHQFCRVLMLLVMMVLRRVLVLQLASDLPLQFLP